MRQPLTSADGWSQADGPANGFGLGLALQPIEAMRDARAVRHALTTTVQAEVIPRLLQARLPGIRRQNKSEAAPATVSDHVAGLVSVALRGPQSAVARYVEAIHDAGVDIDELFLDLLTPAARRLGVLWEDDDCDFTDVTLGVMRLGRVVRDLGRTFSDDYQPGHSGPSALLAQAPGEQHGLGLAMVVQFFRRAGWNVRAEPVVTRQNLTDIVQSEWFGMVGLSVACSDRLDHLAADIEAIRACSRNRAIGVLVGGPAFIADPSLASQVGADATAADGRQAVLRARDLLNLLAIQR